MKKVDSQFSRFLSDKATVTYSVLLLLLIIDRLNCFIRFSRVYTDSDQTIFWLISKNLMAGELHGPCVYGQSYNPIIEPILSIPMLFFGFDYSTALPLTTTFLSVFPMILLSLYIFKRVDRILGSIPLLVSLGMSVEYQMLTSIPRGFVTGIFFWVIGFVLVNFHKSAMARLVGGLLLGFAVYANPNCILLFPILLVSLPISGEHGSFLRFSAPGFLIGVSTIGLNYIYYNIHPEMVIHGSPSISLSIDSFMHVVRALDNYFDFVTPVFWRLGWTSLFLFIIVAWQLWRAKHQKHSIIVMTLFALLVLSFFVSKVSDGTNSVFFSGSRMFLAYPYLILFLLLVLTKTQLKIKKNQALTAMVVFAIISVSVKVLAFDKLVAHAMRGSAYSVVEVIPVEELKSTCRELKSFDEDIDILLANSANTSDQLINYGCPCLVDSFPKTFLPNYERRTWAVSRNKKSIYNRILIYGSDDSVYNDIHLSELDVIRSDQDKSWTLIENQLEMQELLTRLKISEVDIEK